MKLEKANKQREAVEATEFRMATIPRLDMKRSTKRTLLLTIIGLLVGCNSRIVWGAEPKAEKFLADYFPLIEATEYVYLGAFKDKTDEKTMVIRSDGQGDSRIYYFISLEQEKSDNALIIAGSFGLGAYCIEDGSLQTLAASWRSTVKDVDRKDKQKLLPAVLAVGAKAQVMSGDKSLKLTVLEPESVKVPAGEFQECAKISVEEVWPDNNYKGYVWLAKGIGVVKRQYATGRIEELKSYQLPKH